MGQLNIKHFNFYILQHHWTIETLALEYGTLLEDCVVGVMKMENIVSRGRIKTHISDIPDQCATITPRRLPDITTLPTQLLSSSHTSYHHRDITEILLLRHKTITNKQRITHVNNGRHIYQINILH